MTKFKLYFDKDEETKWLNQMAQEGWAMTGFFMGFYSFGKCEPGKYEYQIDFGDRFGTVSNEYREFMRESDIEIVQNWGFWIILRRVASDQPFELYTDVDSALEHYKKIRNMFKVCFVVELLCTLFELVAAIQGFYIGYAFVLLLIALLIVLINAITKQNETIALLEERKTGIRPEYSRKNISVLIPCGLLVNGCALMIQESVSAPIRHTVQIVAIVLMLAGLYLTFRNRKE